MRPRSQRMVRRVVFGGTALLAAVLGCTDTVIRPQSPDEVALPESDIPLVGDYALSAGTSPIAVEAVALVTGLHGTGSDPAPSANRARLVDDLRKRQVVNPNNLLASPNTALVLVRGLLRPGIRKGDRFDIEVRLPSGSDATSLRNGWLMPCDLTELAVAGGGILEGFKRAQATGAILVHPTADESNQPELLRRGFVLGGGVSAVDRPLHLYIQREPSIELSQRIGKVLNERFHAFQGGRKILVAKPRRPEFIDLEVHPRYEDNLARYMQVVRAVAIRATPSQKQRRLESLEKQLLDAVTADTAAIRLEAIGKEAAPVLRKGLDSPEQEVRFYAAEALAYLDDGIAVETLADAARDVPAFRVHALTALGAMDDVYAYDKLLELLDSPSAETRYGAFRALWSMRGQTDAAIHGEWLNREFSFHELNTQGPPMVHVTRSFRPEVVLFGRGQVIRTPVLLEAGGEIFVRDVGEDQLSISRINQSGTSRTTVPATVAELVRGLAEVGGTYPDVVQCLQQAHQAGALPGRFEIEAVPRLGRTYVRGSAATDALGEGSQPASRGITSPSPDLFPEFADDVDPLDSATSEDNLSIESREEDAAGEP
jgi:flagellar basal body P-ring protein FlgI